jgi:hypothetical protein
MNVLVNPPGVDAKVGGVLARALPDQTKDAVLGRLTGFRPPSIPD